MRCRPPFCMEGPLESACRFRPIGVVLVALVFLFEGPHHCRAATKPAKISPKQLAAELQSPARSIWYGDYSVASGVVIESALVVVEGGIDVAAGSVLKGEVWIVNGDLIVASDARVEGPVHLVDGAVFQSRDALITGEIKRYHCGCKLDGEQFMKTGRPVFRRTVDRQSLNPRFAFGSAATNRVDYETIYMGVQRGNPENPRPHWRGHAHLLVPFRNNTRGFLGFDLDLLIPLRGSQAALQFQGFKKTISNDGWQYPVAENAFALFLSHTDFLDYYERSGGRIALVLDPGHSVTITGGVYLDHSQSLQTRGAPSLANNDRPLRDNPAIDHGEILGADLGVTYDTRDNPARPSSSWFLHGWVDAGFKAGPGDFRFTTLTLDFRRYNRLWRKMSLDTRGRIFTGWNNLPRQRLQSLNGYGGVRGMHDIPFPVGRGDRVALFSAELRIPLPQVPVIKILYTRWDLLLFGDVGLLQHNGGSGGPFRFLESPKSAWGKSIGIGVSGEAFLPYLGFYVAQDVTRWNQRPRFIVRAERSF